MSYKIYKNSLNIYSNEEKKLSLFAGKIQKILVAEFNLPKPHLLT